MEINTNSAPLEGKIIIDESLNNVSNVKWSKIEGPGEANFSSNKSLKTTVTFSQAGTYLLRLTADHDYKITDPNVAMYYTLSDYITVKVGQVNNPCNADAEKPVFTYCPPNLTLTTADNSAVATWQLPTATDNCSTPSVSSRFSSGQSFAVGTTTVIYTAVDSKGNQATCQFNVLVKKNETSVADLSARISSNKTDYTSYSDIIFQIVLKNHGASAVSNTKVQFKFPEYMIKNGTETVTGRV